MRERSPRDVRTRANTEEHNGADRQARPGADLPARGRRLRGHASCGATLAVTRSACRSARQGNRVASVGRERQLRGPRVATGSSDNPRVEWRVEGPMGDGISRGDPPPACAGNRWGGHERAATPGRASDHLGWGCWGHRNERATARGTTMPLCPRPATVACSPALSHPPDFAIGAEVPSVSPRNFNAEQQRQRPRRGDLCSCTGRSAAAVGCVSRQRGSRPATASARVPRSTRRERRVPARHASCMFGRACGQQAVGCTMRSLHRRSPPLEARHPPRPRPQPRAWLQSAGAAQRRPRVLALPGAARPARTSRCRRRPQGGLRLEFARHASVRGPCRPDR